MAQVIDFDFTAPGIGPEIFIVFDDLYQYKIDDVLSFDGDLVLEETDDGGISWNAIFSTNAPVDTRRIVEGTNGKPIRGRWRCTRLDSGTAETSLVELPNTILAISEQRQTQTIGARVGATAGWVIGGDDLGLLASLPASKTAATMIVPIDGLKRIKDPADPRDITRQDIIAGFYINGRAGSGGGAVNVQVELHKQKATAGAITDEIIGTMTALNLTTDTLITEVLTRTDLDPIEVVDKNESFYLKITSTTAAGTEIELVEVGTILTQIWALL